MHRIEIGGLFVVVEASPHKVIACMGFFDRDEGAIGVVKAVVNCMKTLPSTDLQAYIALKVPLERQIWFRHEAGFIGTHTCFFSRGCDYW